MLTADLVRARRRDGALQLVALSPAARGRALELAAGYLDAARASEGRPRADFDRACAEVPVRVRERKLAAGLRKLVLDRCDFEVVVERDPAEVRAEVFGRAAAVRREGAGFDRDGVLASAAEALGMAKAEVEETLYADVRDAHVLARFEPISPEGLCAAYELGQAQAVLLRATRVTAEVWDRSPDTFRRLFRRIKFHRLLHRIERLDEGGYRIEISGPFSLFRQVTKYGLQLALVLPAIRACERWSIDANVRWGRDREPLSFALSGECRGGDDAPGGVLLPDEVRTLLERFAKRDTPWRARPCADVLELPGVGLCVPDLLFEHAETGARAYLEVLGYWSREAVWRRVELAEGGLAHPIVFAVSKRLRVSEEVLSGDLPAALVVYKGALSPAAIEARIAQVTGGDPSPSRDTERTS